MRLRLFIRLTCLLAILGASALATPVTAGETTATCVPEEGSICATSNGNTYQNKRCQNAGGGSGSCTSCVSAPGWVCITDEGDFENERWGVATE